MRYTDQVEVQVMLNAIAREELFLQDVLSVSKRASEEQDKNGVSAVMRVNMRIQDVFDAVADRVVKLYCSVRDADLRNALDYVMRKIDEMVHERYLKAQSAFRRVQREMRVQEMMMGMSAI